MTTKLNLRAFLFLLTVSMSISGGRTLGIEVKNLLNTTGFHNYTMEHNNETELQPTSGPRLATVIREDQSAAAPASSQNTSEVAHTAPSRESGATETIYNIEGTEMNTTKHQLANNESLTGTESSRQTPFPENSTLNLTSSAPTVSTSVGLKNRTNATTSVSTVAPHLNTEGPSRTRTTVKEVVPTTTKKLTTQNHMPTTAPRTQNPDKSIRKVCPTAEPKREGLLSRCLITIAGLAALATIFIITTIVLATKLAGSRYRHRASLLHETEMVCISALMNDSDHPIPTPKRPKSNGALIPVTEDEDGDDLTLNSFLHDTEGVA